VKGTDRSEEAEKSTALDLLSFGATSADGLLGGLLILASGNSLLLILLPIVLSWYPLPLGNRLLEA
jgi:hypothetical protein